MCVSHFCLSVCLSVCLSLCFSVFSFSYFTLFCSSCFPIGTIGPYLCLGFPRVSMCVCVGDVLGGVWEGCAGGGVKGVLKCNSP